MGALRVLTAAEQVGEHLRAELCRGAWGGRMPGGARLAVELGVGRDTVEAALQILEQLGMLVPQGVDEIAAHGIETGAFNLADWEETSDQNDLRIRLRTQDAIDHVCEVASSTTASA